MPRPAAQPVTFYVPEVHIAVSFDDVRQVVEELRRLARDQLRPERLRAADLLEQTLAGAHGTQRVLLVPGLSHDEQEALLRAVEHLRWPEKGISGELNRLHGALKGWVPMPHITYELSYGYGGDTVRFWSYTGSYRIGDRLPLTKSNECWEVTHVEASRAGCDDERLVVEPCDWPR